MLLYDERIPAETCSKLAQKSCGRIGKRKPFSVISFDDCSSPSVSFLDYRYWPVKDLELAFRDAANVHTGKKDPLGCLNLRFKLAFVTTREFVDVDCCTASLSPTAF